MATSEIITIGTELLLGEIQDTNTRYLARSLRDAGIDLYRTMMVGDNVSRIASAIQEALTRSDIIITTGGLGPTVDDPTRLAVATALGRELEYRPELWEQILSRFQRYGRQATENNRRQAYIPQGAIPVENPVGTAPSFIIEIDHRVIIALPGVPREMEYLHQNVVLPYLKDHFHLQGIIKALVLHAATMGESQIDDIIGDLEAASNPTVGLLAHPGQVDIRVTAKAVTEEEADQMIQGMVDIIHQRLGDVIYGHDEDTLEKVASMTLAKQNWSLGVVEAGLDGLLIERFATLLPTQEISQNFKNPFSAEELKVYMTSLRLNQPGILLGASLVPGKEKQNLYLVFINPEGVQEMQRSYGGPPGSAPAWAVNLCLDLIRKSNLKG